jgi:hypothetical protein
MSHFRCSKQISVPAGNRSQPYPRPTTGVEQCVETMGLVHQATGAKPESLVCPVLSDCANAACHYNFFRRALLTSSITNAKPCRLTKRRGNRSRVLSFLGRARLECPAAVLGGEPRD